MIFFFELVWKRKTERHVALIKNKFTCGHRGKIYAKNIGEIDMYFVEEKILSPAPDNPINSFNADKVKPITYNQQD